MRRKRSYKSFDMKDAENVVQEWLDNGSLMMTEPVNNLISPFIAKSGEYVLHG